MQPKKLAAGLVGGRVSPKDREGPCGPDGQHFKPMVGILALAQARRQNIGQR